MADPLKVPPMLDRVLGILAVSSLVYFFSYPGVDNDLWGHLFFGREILSQGGLPTTNLYSYTAPGHPWINHEWLAEIVFYGIYRLLGSSGLILLKVLLGGAILWMLSGIVRRRTPHPWLGFLTLIWVMAVLSPGFNIRPQVFTYGLFTVFLFLFYRWEERPSWCLLYVPVLTVLWVNLHGGVVAGLGALGLFFLVNTLRLNFEGGGSRVVLMQLVLPSALALLALLVNPYGVELLGFLWRDLRLDRPISEWDPVPLWDLSFIEFKLALLVVLVSLRQGAWRRWEVLLTLLAAVLALRHQRHIPLFAIAAAPLLAEGMERLLHALGGLAREKGWEEWSPAVWKIFSSGILLLVFLLWAWIGKIHVEHRFRVVVSPLEYPTQAADFLLRNRIEGNLAVPFDWGEYFIWKLSPGSRVSIDGRYTTAYPHRVIEDSWEWMGGGQKWSRLNERYPTEIAVTKRSHGVTSLLRHHPEWVYIYSDPIAFIFVRTVPSQSELLERFREKKLVPPQQPTVYFPG